MKSQQMETERQSQTKKALRVTMVRTLTVGFFLSLLAFSQPQYFLFFSSTFCCVHSPHFDKWLSDVFIIAMFGLMDACVFSAPLILN